MRRLTLTLALAGAVAAAGCSGGATSTTGGNPGVTEGTFRITIQNGQDGNASLAIQGGWVTSTPARIDCGVGAHNACSFDFAAGTIVTLTANPIAPNLFLGWAGDCSGEGACSLTGNADRYVVVSFGTERTRHPNWSDPVVHAARYDEFASAAPSALACTSCHGGSLQGTGIAVGCGSCHPRPALPSLARDVPVIASEISGALTGSPITVTLEASDRTPGTATCSAAIVSQPAGSEVTLAGAASGACEGVAKAVSFTPALTGVYTLRVTATNASGATTRDVYVGASPYGGGVVSGKTPAASPSTATTRLIADLGIAAGSSSGVSAESVYRAFANITTSGTPAVTTQGPPLTWEQRPYDVVDIRDAASFAAGHIPGAVNVPLQDLPNVLLAQPWFPAADASSARKVLVAGYTRGDSSLGGTLLVTSRFSQGAIPASASVSHLTDGMSLWTLNKGAVPYRWDDDLGTARFEWTLANTNYLESSPAGTTFSKAGKPTYELPSIGEFTGGIETTNVTNAAAMRRILVRAREWTRWAVTDADARNLPRAEAFVTNWGLYKKLRDSGERHRVVTNQSDAQWAAARAIGAYRGSGAGSLNPLNPADLSLLNPDELVLYHCFSNGSAVAPCFRMAMLGYKSRTVLYGITGAVKRDATGIAAGHNAFYAGLTDASIGGSDFPVSSSSSDPQSLAWAQPGGTGCRACHTDYGTLYTLAALEPSAPPPPPLSEGEG